MDHFVLGSVVHEDPAQIGDQRDREDVDEEECDTDEAFHQVEQEGVREGRLEVLDDHQRYHHEEADGERDGHDDGDGQFLPSERHRFGRTALAGGHTIFGHD